MGGWHGQGIMALQGAHLVQQALAIVLVSR